MDFIERPFWRDQSAETETEFDSVIAGYLKEENIVLQKNSEFISNVIDHLKKNGISVEYSDFSYFYSRGLLLAKKNLLQSVFPDLNRTKDGLTPMSVLTDVTDFGASIEGYYTRSSFDVMLSCCFRRGLSRFNNWAPNFVSAFTALRDPMMTSYVRLDPHALRIPTGNDRYYERDTWYGAPFNDDIASIEDGISVLRPPAGLKDRHVRFLFRGAYSLEIEWRTVRGIKSFQAVEFKMDSSTSASGDSMVFPVRYLHAEFDLESECFRHFDGAMMWMTEEEYLLRRDGNFIQSKNGRATKPRYEKLFRIDGSVPTDVWREISSHFLAGNPLIHEYFTGSLPPHVIEALNRIALNEKDEPSR